MPKDILKCTMSFLYLRKILIILRYKNYYFNYYLIKNLIIVEFL